MKTGLKSLIFLNPREMPLNILTDNKFDKFLRNPLTVPLLPKLFIINSRIDQIKTILTPKERTQNS